MRGSNCSWYRDKSVSADEPIYYANERLISFVPKDTGCSFVISRSSTIRLPRLLPKKKKKKKKKHPSEKRRLRRRQTFTLQGWPEWNVNARETKLEM